MSFGFSFIRSYSGPGPDRHDRASRPYRGEPRTATRNRGYTREIYSDGRERRAEHKNEGGRHHQQYYDQPPRHETQANNSRSTETQGPRYREHYGEEDVPGGEGKEDEEEMRHTHRRTQRKKDDDEKYYYTSPRGKAEDVSSRQARHPAEEGTKGRRGGGGGPRSQHRDQDGDGSDRRYQYDRAPQQQQRQRQQRQRDASTSPRPRMKSSGEVVDAAYKHTHESWELQPIKHRRRPGDVPYEKSLAYHLTHSWWPKG